MFTAGAQRAAALGYEGKWAIHPSQIDLANEVFTPQAPGTRSAPAWVVRRLVNVTAAGPVNSRHPRGQMGLVLHPSECRDRHLCLEGDVPLTSCGRRQVRPRTRFSSGS